MYTGHDESAERQRISMQERCAGANLVAQGCYNLRRERLAWCIAAAVSTQGKEKANDVLSLLLRGAAKPPFHRKRAGVPLCALPGIFLAPVSHQGWSCPTGSKCSSLSCAVPAQDITFAFLLAIPFRRKDGLFCVEPATHGDTKRTTTASNQQYHIRLSSGLNVPTLLLPGCKGSTSFLSQIT